MSARSAPAGAVDRWFVTGGGMLADGADPAARLGTPVGPFRLVAEIGRGGMATVYLAERVDGAFEQQVAIKVFELAPDGALADRFRAERQALARLDHPAIARIYDGGELADGAPYLVLEFVRGKPVDEHGDGLTLAARLALFREVGRAVAAAHAEGIVHHDLKPGNILVDRHGHPKLLDFGIARVLARELGQQQEAEQQLLTPRWGAPEQFEGRSAGPATDVFQLGLILYRLVTGREAGTGASLATLRDEVHRLPHQLASELARAADRRVDRHFDRIVARCLAPTPGDRYRCVGDLLADFDAWDRGLPSSFTRASRGAQLRHWLARRRAALLASLALTAVVAGALAWSWHQVESQQARTRAVSELVTEVLAQGENEVISAHSFEIASGAIADQPALERELARLQAERLLAAGQPGAAIDLLEPVLRRAAGGFEGVDRAWAELHGLLAEALRRQARHADAVRHFRLALTLGDAASPSSVRAATADGLAAALIAAGDLADAERTLARVAGEPAIAPEHRDELAATARLVADLRRGICPATTPPAATALRSAAAAIDACRPAAPKPID